MKDENIINRIETPALPDIFMPEVTPATLAEVLGKELNCSPNDILEILRENDLIRSLTPMEMHELNKEELLLKAIATHLNANNTFVELFQYVKKNKIKASNCTRALNEFNRRHSQDADTKLKDLASEEILLPGMDILNQALKSMVSAAVNKNNFES